MAEDSYPLDSFEDRKYLVLIGIGSFLALATIFLIMNRRSVHFNEEFGVLVLSTFFILSPIIFISAIIAIFKFGREFYNTFFLTSLISWPVSVWEYTNQSRNACMFWCGSIPPADQTPIIIFFSFQIILLIYANSWLMKENWKNKYGILYALWFSTFVYLIAYLVGSFS